MMLAASDGSSHLMAQNAMFVLKGCITYGKEKVLKTFIVIAILKVIVPTSGKAVLGSASMLVIAMALGTLTQTLDGILFHVL